MENLEQKNENELVKRPTYLSVLCILTFISTGIGCVTSLLTPPLADMMTEFIKISPAYDETLMAEIIRILHAGWVYYLTTFVLTLLSLIGAILMWNLKKIGFHFYALSNLALLFVPTLILGITISWFGIFFSAGFIGLYAFHLKFMS